MYRRLPPQPRNIGPRCAFGLRCALLSWGFSSLASPANGQGISTSATLTKPVESQLLPANASDRDAEAVPTREALLRISADLARGYYHALVQGQFAQAAGFLHPAFLDELYQQWLRQVRDAVPAVQKAQLAQMGLTNISAASLLQRTQFFVRYAQSPAGVGLRALSDPALLHMRAVVENQSCDPIKRTCLVLLRLKGTREDGGTISAPQSVWVRFADGKYWVDTRRQPPNEKASP